MNFGVLKMIKKSVVLLFTILTIAILASAQSQETLTRTQKERVIEDLTKLLERFYIFPEISAKMASHVRTRLKKGDYDALNDASQFARTISDDLRSISKDLHLGFSYNPQQADGLRRLASQSEEEARKANEEFLAQAKQDNFGFRKVERLQGNVGYLDFRYFASASQAAPTAVAAMNFLANCDAIMIDLRKNGGGDPTQIQFISSYFFSEPTHLNDIYTRSKNVTEHFWTLPYVPGTKLEKADLYVLTSKYTFSGAEEFSYNMKNLKRATLIGETTGGGAHPTDQEIVQEKFVLDVPSARAINPVTKTNWEGTGVTPDITVPASEAFDRAYILALEKLAQRAATPEKKSQLEWTIAAHKAKTNPIRLSDTILSQYAGVYEDRKVTIEGGALHYQRRGPKYRMIPVNETTFIIDGLDDIRFEFVVKGGKVTELIGVYPDGSKEPSKRTS
jgi:retinol-binding protein 3